MRFCLLLLCATLAAGILAATPDARARAYLAAALDRYAGAVDVYRDAGSAGNHFTAVQKLPGATTPAAMTDTRTAAGTCLTCSFDGGKAPWGGFLFQNGVLAQKAVLPAANWGTVRNAGLDLTGATRLTFRARGAKGGEQVEFYAGGTGWAVDFAGNAVRPERPHADSFTKVSTHVTLTSAWKSYAIDLHGYDLHYVIGGFGWMADGALNGRKPMTFFLDDIRWEVARPATLRFLVSYEGGDDVAWSYDNALALLAFLAQHTADGDRRAGLLADAFVYAASHDRFYTDGRLRNAYLGGDLACPPGWAPNGVVGAARLPGRWDAAKKRWNEDQEQVSTYTGNAAWAVIALVAASERLHVPAYLAAAERLGEWIATQCKDQRGAGGYLAGYQGWEPAPKKLQYKSTEHNLDCVAAFRRLASATQAMIWEKRAVHAQTFVHAMWDAKAGCYRTGTREDGITVNTDAVPLDAQAWAVLVLGKDAKAAALDYAAAHHAVGGGYDFNEDRDGVWYEGTAQIATALDKTKAAPLLKTLDVAQLPSGALPAASVDGLTTGFYITPPTGKPVPWTYPRRGHIGATAWYLFAKAGVNPFWMK
jgi:hypothetical protein